LLMARTNPERTAEKKKNNNKKEEDLPSNGVARGADEENARDKKKRALLVDDHNLFRGILAVICEEHTELGGNVQAGSLTEARRLLSTTSDQASDFALAIVDLDLPEEGGVELIGELRRAGIPVLALTTRSHFCSEANEVLSTAVSSDELLGTVKRLMSAPSSSSSSSSS
jgi:DNA-binding NarL/FixJ family response regulator